MAIQWPEEEAVTREVWSEADMLVETGPGSIRRGPARHLTPGRLLARRLHRHGFAARFNGAECIATMRRQGEASAVSQRGRARDITLSAKGDVGTHRPLRVIRMRQG